MSQFFPRKHKGYTYGTHRLCDPEETYRSISQHFPTMGITRIADITGLDSVGIPVCMSVRPNSKSISVSQGKGMNLMLARVSAAMESIETYHAENITGEIISATYNDLSLESEAADPLELNLHPVSIYHHDLPIPWMRGYDMLKGRNVYVPYDLVHTDFRHDPLAAPVFKSSSNGLASGNHLSEAISHAICEVVERDATALWELRKVQPELDPTTLDLHTIDSLPCRELLGKLEQAELGVCVWNQTSDVGIPSFGCAIYEHYTENPLSPRSVFGGYGAHLSKEIALIRAITEAAQSRLTYISGARDDVLRKSYRMPWIKNYHNHWDSILSNVQPNADYRDLPSLETNSLDGDVQTQLSLLKKAGFERVIYLDLTQPEIGIPVARVIIPKAEVSYETKHSRYGDRARKFVLLDMLKKGFLQKV